ncbi:MULTISPECIES: hypothetical protein [Bradyrhizobium]|uniref:hypothetical protein n=1 Tax=Bradyrhizobium centrosematis TaxID=1300039 RepID=UPI00216715AE|nr:hypothetical protein [Bradyrhizobium centrosematis]MCS3765634.1 enoyl-CoA hydratase/carnithine racemase [Bradyrhizobium centrosematis]MCS3778168.1 enoyl-CoA hydratase/carnithine racemase [Bradyrhizobium centrosematis]
MQRLTLRVGYDIAMDLMLTHCSMYTKETTQRSLVNKIVDSKVVAQTAFVARADRRLFLLQSMG